MEDRLKTTIIKATLLGHGHQDHLYNFKAIPDVMGSSNLASQLAAIVDWPDLDGNLLISNHIFVGMNVVDGNVTFSEFPGIWIIKKE